MQLNPKNAQGLQLANAVLRAAPQYMLDTFGRLPTEADGHHLMNDVSAGCRPEDILIFVAFEQDVAIGLMQVHRAFVHAHRANIGLLMVRPEHCRRGHGSTMLQQLSELSGEWPGISHFSAAVLENNVAGLAFWRSAGFRTVGSGYRKPGCPSPLTVMEREARPPSRPPVFAELPQGRSVAGFSMTLPRR